MFNRLWTFWPTHLTQRGSYPGIEFSSLENHKILQETIAAYWRQTIIFKKTHEPWYAPLLLGLHERCSTHNSAASYSKIGLACLHILKETPSHQCICLLVKGSQHLSLVQKKGLTKGNSSIGRKIIKIVRLDSRKELTTWPCLPCSTLLRNSWSSHTLSSAQKKNSLGSI